jgi:hypothetical protein
MFISLLLIIYSVEGMPWNIFYHFVGAVPESRDLGQMLRRFLQEMDLLKDMPKEKTKAAQQTYNALCSINTSPVIVLVDNVNQVSNL